MATIVLSAAGAALGGSVGGTLAGLSSVAIGRAVGATLGRAIDQRLLGAGADPVETGQIDRFRLTDAADGAAIPQVYGRMRVGGQVIWSTDFTETSSTSGGGKGTPSVPETTSYEYYVSLAIALCEGEIGGVTRVWADGEEIAPADIDLVVYRGTADQMPDPTMEAVEGAGAVPAYRGTAYVVMENLALEPYGNRVPQFSFEVVRAAQPGSADHEQDITQSVKGVALIPGTGEYTLATTPVYYDDGTGTKRAANLNAPSGFSDLETAMDALGVELPNCQSTALVVSWFGTDLRCGSCEVLPMVEQSDQDGEGMAWSVSGLSRAQAEALPKDDEDRSIYGGTPADGAVLEAIRHMNDIGQSVMFYPFILMRQLTENGLPDPWTGAPDQPALPWRGRITLSIAPGQDGTPDRTSGADAEVAAFFGSATAADFTVGDGTVTYSGSDGWTFRRFILHYAALCAAAGGVEAFCIGSEMRSLTQIRGANDRFAAVAELQSLAQEVRTLLGTDVQVGYAADWSEYFGYQPVGENSQYFHLDALWADDAIDFIGIDNYMPLSDWRDGDDHADASFGTIYDPTYLRGNIEGGEGYDWYYHSNEARAAQIRTPIEDGAYGEPWVYRYKDFRNWWLNAHHDRVDGVRAAAPTPWEPQSKPVRFTELGCAAVDKGTNEPNKFLDPKSSESALPQFSNGARDDLIQRRYLETMLGYWAEVEKNPLSDVYGGPMIDLEHCYVWAYDARPFPVFPNAVDIWSDGLNYLRGHWISGRAAGRTLASVVAEICDRAGVLSYDVGQLYGFVRGYIVEEVGDARAALQPLMLRFAFDAVERDGVLMFLPRDTAVTVPLDAELLAENDELEVRVERTRMAEAELAGRVRLRFVEADGDHAVVAEEAVLPDEATHSVSSNEIPIALTRGEGRLVVERWLAEARVARDTARFALPLSKLSVGSGDIVELPGDSDGPTALYRVDRVEQADMQLIEAVRIEPSIYAPADIDDDLPSPTSFVAPVPVSPFFLDLPLITGDEVPNAPHIAVTADPWPGTVALHASDSGNDYVLDKTLSARATIGVTETPLFSAAASVWDHGDAVQVRLLNGSVQSRDRASILNGGNLAAIGDGSSDVWELFQFETAELVAENTYLLSTRLRGQLGTDAFMPDVWPAGSTFVLMNGAPEQISLSSAQLRRARHYRIGPAGRPYDDPAYVTRIESFDGNGLRPYTPVHLRITNVGSDLYVSWVRRTRIDGDSWDLAEVPLGEAFEQYIVRVVEGTTVLREETVTSPNWHYTASQIASDAAGPAAELQVAQVSERYGPGPFARLPIWPT